MPGSAWLDAHTPAGRASGRLAEARRAKPVGTQRLRHFELVEAAAEDMMHCEVGALRPEHGAAGARRLRVETGASGLPVFGQGPRPGFLDSRELLAGLAQRLSA